MDSQLIAFVVIAAILTITPGADMALVRDISRSPAELSQASEVD